MQMMFFGTSAFAVPSLERLVEAGHQIVWCITQPERPQGRGLQPRPSPVKFAAQRLGVPVEEPDAFEPVAGRLRQASIDAAVVISYGRLIPGEWLRLPRHGFLGLHPSLLPRYRGANPVAWAILQGETATGVTVFRLNERMDAGDILLQEPVPIAPDDTAERLSARLAQQGARVLVQACAQLEREAVLARPQDERQATYTAKFTKRHGQIEWTQPAVLIERLIRAAIPWPGALSSWQGRLLKIWAAGVQPAGDSPAGHPGEVVRAGPEDIAVATADGTLVIQEVQLAGGRRLSAREFLAGHALRRGDRLGA